MKVEDYFDINKQILKCTVLYLA